ncbi:MAG TPA: cobalamin biosynthesis protein [Streptosporangiaceae bacterium]|nr:cobalamin biosynthesis protein [Streptosporangiaceae bacterium]
MRRRWPGLATGLLIGAALDALLADPPSAHPVALFGSTATRAEHTLWADTRTRGVAFTAACVVPVAAAGWTLAQISRRKRLAATLATAAATWTVLGGASLAAEATRIAEALDAGDLDTARRRLPALCGRDPDTLDAAEIARATVESVAENTSDAVVAPLLWGAAAGLPGLLAYRAVNTLDAMVGHRSPRYARFGWSSARLDDIANLAPARLTALLAAALSPAVGGTPRAALAVLHRDGANHPSPNAGHCEAAFAGALGIRLGGTNTYKGRVEQRGLLGNGRAPTSDDIERAVRLSRLITLAATLISALLAHYLHGRKAQPAGAPLPRSRP